MTFPTYTVNKCTILYLLILIIKVLCIFSVTSNSRVNMKKAENIEQVTCSPLRRVSLSLLAFLLLFISVSNEIPVLHNHSPMAACAINDAHHSHCGTVNTPLAIQSSIEKEKQCLFFQWNKLSHSQAIEFVALTTPEDFARDASSRCYNIIKTTERHSYQLRAPPYVA